MKTLLPSSILTIWPTHLSLLDLITLTILGEQYKLWRSSLWSLLRSPFSSLLDQNTRVGILFEIPLACLKSIYKNGCLYVTVSLQHCSTNYRENWHVGLLCILDIGECFFVFFVVRKYTYMTVFQQIFEKRISCLQVDLKSGL